MTTTPTKTKVINNFNGRLTRFRDGDINSGKANFYSSWGYDTFGRSGTLTFSQSPVDITKSVITDLVMAGKVRVENGSSYLYAIGHTGRLYKIQVNDAASYNPDYDNPVLLGTLTGSLTFKFGSSLDFYQGGGTEKIWIGHDTGMTKIGFDGTGQTNLTSASWIANVPRQQVQVLGKIYITNGSNLAEIDSTEAVTTYTKLSPGFPTNSQARDLDVTADGNYIVAVVTRNPVTDMTSVAVNTSDPASMPSLIVKWDGTSAGASSSISIPSFTMTSYHTFSSYEYVFGYQIGGTMLGTPSSVILVDEFTNPPFPNAIGSSGDFLGWATTSFDISTGHTNALLSLYGTIDVETPKGHYRQLIKTSSLAGGDVIRIPFYTSVTSWVSTGSTSGYTTAPFQLLGTGKTYFSTLEYNNPTTSYGFYMFKNVADFLSSTGTGVYETQHEVFERRVRITEYRIYMEPVTSSVSFKIDLIGIDGAVISGGTKTFSSLTNETMVSFNPAHAPSGAIGVRITNAGAVSPFIHKIELDYTEYGK